MDMSAALLYSLKVWLTSLALGSFMLWSSMIVFSPAKDVEWSSIPMFLALTLLIAMLISLPTLIMFFITCYYLSSIKTTAILFRTVVSLVSIAACFVTFYFIAKSDQNSVFDKGSFTLLLCYSLPIPVCVWLYKRA